ncbi:hypothetical protein XENOCAPTIV_026842, partial [Xenoophorus captivus]
FVVADPVPFRSIIRRLLSEISLLLGKLLYCVLLLLGMKFSSLTAFQEFAGAYSLVDSSQVSTFLISILLIVYGSFRSLNMDCENQEKDKDGGLHYLHCRISFGCCGRFTLAELLSFSLSVMLVLIWVLTGHWLLMDGASLSQGSHDRVFLSWEPLAMGLCVAMIAFVRLPSLKVSCLLLSGLLIYDVFWVRSDPTNFTCITKRKHGHEICRLPQFFRKRQQFWFMMAFICSSIWSYCLLLRRCIL